MLTLVAFTYSCMRLKQFFIVHLSSMRILWTILFTITDIELLNLITTKIYRKHTTQRWSRLVITVSLTYSWVPITWEQHTLDCNDSVKDEMYYKYISNVSVHHVNECIPLFANVSRPETWRWHLKSIIFTVQNFSS